VLVQALLPALYTLTLNEPIELIDAPTTDTCPAVQGVPILAITMSVAARTLAHVTEIVSAVSVFKLVVELHGTKTQRSKEIAVL